MSDKDTRYYGYAGSGRPFPTQFATQFAQSLVAAALGAFPYDPDWPDDRETITAYELVDTTDVDFAIPDPNVPDQYHAPEIGPAEPVARAVAIAVLETLANAYPTERDTGASCEEAAELYSLAAEIRGQS